jgi:hypothetical protein
MITDYIGWIGLYSKILSQKTNQKKKEVHRIKIDNHNNKKLKMNQKS